MTNSPFAKKFNNQISREDGKILVKNYKGEEVWRYPDTAILMEKVKNFSEPTQEEKEEYEKFIKLADPIQPKSKEDVLDIMIAGGFSPWHLDLIHDKHPDKYDSSHKIIEVAKDFITPPFNAKSQPWLFVAASSGAGKTSAFHYLVYKLLKEKNYESAGYFVMSEMIDKIYNKQLKMKELLKYQILVIDDFFKDESHSRKIQNIVKVVIDFYLRHNGVMIFGADIDPKTIFERLDPEYRDQIIYRIKERCGKNIFGFNKLPNLRKEAKLIQGG